MLRPGAPGRRVRNGAQQRTGGASAARARARRPACAHGVVVLSRRGAWCSRATWSTSRQAFTWFEVRSTVHVLRARAAVTARRLGVGPPGTLAGRGGSVAPPDGPAAHRAAQPRCAVRRPWCTGCEVLRPWCAGRGARCSRTTESTSHHVIPRRDVLPVLRDSRRVPDAGARRWPGAPMRGTARRAAQLRRAATAAAQRRRGNTGSAAQWRRGDSGSVAARRRRRGDRGATSRCGAASDRRR